MKYDYVVLGAGRQGTAIAYDLAKFGDAKSVSLLDQNAELAHASAARVNKLSKTDLARGEALDVIDESALAKALDDADVCISAVPYRFNLNLARAAIRTKTHFCDLGGNTDIVREQLVLAPQAQAAGIGVVPDCGLAPGMANSLALFILGKLKAIYAVPHQIKIYCGGLPQEPKPPLDYQMLFSMDGLINEYDSPVYSLRGGKIEELEPLTELEEIVFSEPVGRCEAFLTSGGTSTAPWRYQQTLESYEYKTVRYPGHCGKIKTCRDLGLWDAAPRRFPDGKIAPRAVFAEVAGSRLHFPDAKDLVVLRVVGIGEKAEAGQTVRIELDLLDFFDPATGFTAMERTTGFPTAIVAIMLAGGQIAPGANPPDPAVPAASFVKALLRRGFELRETVEGPLSIG